MRGPISHWATRHHMRYIMAFKASLNYIIFCLDNGVHLNTRVSTDNQAEKEYNSCKAQEEKLKAYIKSQEGLKLYKVYSDPGFSGASLERPALKEMLNDIIAGKIDCVLTVGSIEK